MKNNSNIKLSKESMISYPIISWKFAVLPLRLRLHYIKHTIDWLYCSGCWFHLGSAYLHIIMIYCKRSLLYPNLFS